ncbi:MAG: fimbrillin family protein [Tidjanibacter sp.]|nr:fimbrillin family protein [Tidjanibacter sp.]
MKKFSTIAILALMFVGCNNNFDTVEPTVEGTPMTIVATTADEAAEGRTALNTADGKTVVWKTGDKLGVFCEYLGTNEGASAQHVDRYQQPYTLTSGDGTTNGVFEGTSSHATFDETPYGTGGKYRFHAYYPLNEANASVLKGKLTGTLAAVQSYDVTDEYNDMSANDVMIGQYLTGTKEDTSIPLEFQHVFAMMTFEVSNPSEETIVVNKIEMTTESGLYLSGAYTLQANKPLAQGTNPSFGSGSASVGVSLSNGSVAAGKKITARLMFNRWAATDGKTLTVKVYTNKGAQTFDKTATDFTGKNSWGMRLALDPKAMVSATVDNYDSATMTLWDSTTSLPTNLTVAGTYCIDGEVAYGANCQLRVPAATSGTTNVSFVGRNTKDGAPKDIFTTSLVQSKNAKTDKIDLLLKDLNLASFKTSTQIIRFNSSAYTLNSLTIENCVIDCSSVEGAPIMICDANHGTLNVVIRNCTFKNCGTTIINGSGAGGSENLSFTFENNKIHSTAASVESLLNLSGCTNAAFTKTIQNNTLVSE